MQRVMDYISTGDLMETDLDTRELVYGLKRKAEQFVKLKEGMK